MRGKKWDIQWPLSAEMVEAINANFDVLFRLIGSATTATAAVSSGGGGGSLLPDPVTPAHGGTGLTTVSTGSLLVGVGGNAWTLLLVGSVGQSLMPSTASSCGLVWGTPSVLLGSRSTVSIATGTLSVDAEGTGSIAIAKSALLVHLTADRKARVRLYQTTGSLAADAARPIGTDPTAGAPHGILLDLYVDDSVWPVAGGGPLSPPVIVVNGNTPAATAIYYAVTNKSSSTASVGVDLLCVPLET